MKKFLFVLPFLLLASSAHAAITIGALTQLCAYGANGKETAVGAHASCQSYIAGVIDYHELFKSVSQQGAKVDFCLPPSLTYSDLQRIILEYLQRNSSHPESPASAAILLGLREEFPCSTPMMPPPAPATISDPLAGGTTADQVLNTPAQ